MQAKGSLCALETQYWVELNVDLAPSATHVYQTINLVKKKHHFISR